MSIRKLTLLFSIALLIAAGCRAGEPEAPDELPYDSYGEDFTPGATVPVAQIASSPQDYLNREVQVRGTVSEVCRNKGCWLMLDAGQGREVRVTFADYGFFVPKDILGRNAVLKGTVQHETLDEDMRRHYAEDGGATPDELEAITGPEDILTIVADGVLIHREQERPAVL